MHAGDAYHLKAAQFLKKAQQETHQSLRAEFERLAASYTRLADQAERNAKTDTVYETPSALSGAQMQQQPKQDE